MQGLRLLQDSGFGLLLGQGPQIRTHPHLGRDREHPWVAPITSLEQGKEFSPPFLDPTYTRSYCMCQNILISVNLS